MKKYLMHHGRLGQKWGKKNGPPYPLDFNKLSEEERKEAKKKSIDEGDVTTAAANLNHYTRQELLDLKNRFETNKEIKQLSSSQIKTGMDKAEEIANKLQRMSDIANKGSSFYNSMAKIANAFGDTDLPYITGPGGGDGKKKKKKGK